jgi:membrane-associated HD superfamily phosphohydrolase
VIVITLTSESKVTQLKLELVVVAGNDEESPASVEDKSAVIDEA